MPLIFVHLNLIRWTQCILPWFVFFSLHCASILIHVEACSCIQSSSLLNYANYWSILLAMDILDRHLCGHSKNIFAHYTHEQKFLYSIHLRKKLLRNGIWFFKFKKSWQVIFQSVRADLYSNKVYVSHILITASIVQPC